MIKSETIGAALRRVKQKAEENHSQIVQSSEISRADRELLQKAGWLQEIIRGWYMLVRPDLATGDTAVWYANFWDFMRRYLSYRFQNEYCLSAESSLDCHTQNPTVPKQVIVISKMGTGIQKLMHHSSLMIYQDLKALPKVKVDYHGINIMPLGMALCKGSPSYFQKNAREAELALRMVKTSDEITRFIIEKDLKAAADRLTGAYEFLGAYEMAQAIREDLHIAGITVKPKNPFIQEKALTTGRIKSPYAGRIHAMWGEARLAVVKHFPPPPGLPKHPQAYLDRIDSIYQYDAYHSLSIEGYHVTEDLIERVKNKKWNPMQNKSDNEMQNALAARGYYDAFLEVKKSINKIIKGENAAVLVRKNLQKWYQKLFGPSVNAGILSPGTLLGYRDDRVFIRNSRHAPPPKEAVLDSMEAFFDCLEAETHPGVSAILGHYFFVFIHPYMDGNGRIGRFLMNTLLAGGGYPWTVVRVTQRQEYIDALENTHINFEMTAFTKFIVREMKEALSK